MAKRPYRFRTIIHLFVLVTMLSSALITIVAFALLRAMRVLPPAFFATIWMPAVILVVANIVSGLVQMILVPRVVRPIERVIRATDKVAKGDFTVRISEKNGAGEVKELVQSFNAMTEELGSTEIFRSDFIRNFSHEFKTPMVSIEGFARQLKRTDLSEEERQNYCNIIIEEARRLTGMSQNILLLSKFENQQIVPDKVPYRLDEQLRDCILRRERAWEKKGLEWELELAPVTLCQNGEALFHVWDNLISNAIKFTPEGGKLSMTASENESSAVVTLRDTGIGMTEEEMKHIFDKCYQADSSHSGEGNGLGLCIAKRVTELCGGSISVRSKKGEGSVFTVILPKENG